MTNMAFMPIRGKHLKIFFSRANEPMDLNRGMLHLLHEIYKDCSNDELGITLSFFTARSSQAA